jgi:hypothetical protein
MANCSLFQEAYDIIRQTISDLENLSDSEEPDGIIMRLDYLSRSLVNVDNLYSTQTDTIIRMIEESIIILLTNSAGNTMEGAAKQFSGNRLILKRIN